MLEENNTFDYYVEYFENNNRLDNSPGLVEKGYNDEFDGAIIRVNGIWFAAIPAGFAAAKAAAIIAAKWLL